MMFAIRDFRLGGGIGTSSRPRTPRARICQALVQAVTVPARSRGRKGGPEASSLWNRRRRHRPPPSLPGPLQTPGKSEFLWQLQPCLLDQTGLGVGLRSAKWWAWRGNDSWRVESCVGAWGRAGALPLPALPGLGSAACSQHNPRGWRDPRWGQGGALGA